MNKIVDKFDGWILMDCSLLKERREQMKFPYCQKKIMSQYVGADSKCIKAYEDGKIFPSLSTFKKLCLYLQLSPQELLGIEEVKE